MQIDLNSPVSVLRGVGDKISVSLEQAGVLTVWDLINYYPRDYLDYSNFDSIENLQPGAVTAKVRISDIQSLRRRGNLHITQAVASDGTGALKIVWFNQPYRATSIKADQDYLLSGELSFSYGTYQIVNPTIEISSKQQKGKGKIIARYPERKQLKSNQIHNIFSDNSSIFDLVDSILPADITEENNLLEKSDALLKLHLPTTNEDIEQARKSLSFEELFELQLTSLVIKSELKQFKSPKLKFNQRSTKDFLARLSFKLTDAQRKSSWQILQDLDSKSAMNRLLQGDVGSGKTIVAGLAANQTLENGYQVALMAPTEVLANQHYKTLSGLFDGSKLAILTSDTPKKQRADLLSKVEAGEPLIVVGTHAIIQKDVNFKTLGLAIIDEQHRFGVAQRKKLMSGESTPHLLAMTATPIPRSLALTVYGELDLSIIDKLPPGRKPIKTVVMPFDANQQIDRIVSKSVKDGSQVYVICPLVEESEAIEAKDVEQEFQRIKKAQPGVEVGLLHGRLKSDQKLKSLDDFKHGKTQILVSTTVIEVGVDVPRASLIVIEGADRFGLAQLHQLRGRVGRSDIQSSCILVTSQGVKPSKRLRAMEQTNSGFELAEIDLKIRGPGAIYGNRQHGMLDLRIANISDTKTIANVRTQAKAFLDLNPDLGHYLALKKRIKQLRSSVTLN